jgi:hypothetical protein
MLSLGAVKPDRVCVVDAQSPSRNISSTLGGGMEAGEELLGGIAHGSTGGIKGGLCDGMIGGPETEF